MNSCTLQETALLNIFVVEQIRGVTPSTRRYCANVFYWFAGGIAFPTKSLLFAYHLHLCQASAGCASIAYHECQISLIGKTDNATFSKCWHNVLGRRGHADESSTRINCCVWLLQFAATVTRLCQRFRFPKIPKSHDCSWSLVWPGSWTHRMLSFSMSSMKLSLRWHPNPSNMNTVGPSSLYMRRRLLISGTSMDRPIHCINAYWQNHSHLFQIGLCPQCIRGAAVPVQLFRGKR